MRAKWVVKWAVFITCLLAAIVLAQPRVTVIPVAAPPASTVTISITGAVGERCGIEIRDPATALVYTREVTIPAGGTASVKWDIPSAARLGTYTIYVTCTVTGAATTTMTVTAVVGGEARKDITPIVSTLAVVALVAASFILARRKFK